MPVATLFVEGKLESELLNPILSGQPALKVGGSKNALKPRARTERDETKTEIAYLRDRDFDFDPPADLTNPTVDASIEEVPFGWRWCRHEIENYLLEPRLIEAATGWPAQEANDALSQIAGEIRHYQIARWTIGTVRRSLPPNHELKTRPAGLNEIGLPLGLSQEAISAWATQQISDFAGRLADQVQAGVLQNLKSTFHRRFDEAFLSDVKQVLLWFSGKDLLAGLQRAIPAKVPNAGSFRADLRDWVRANPERALDLLPEWQSLVNLLRA